MKIIREIGRVVFGLAFIGLGVFQIVQGSANAGLVPNFMPVPTIWVYVTGVAYILAAISIIIEVQTALACTLLGLLVFLIAFSVHGMNLLHRQDVVANASLFLEALAIGAGAFYIAGWFGIPTRRVVTEVDERPRRERRKDDSFPEQNDDTFPDQEEKI
jgi:uncharacterized membrane protein